MPDMTDAEIAELVKGLRFMAQTWNDNRNLNKAADALEQQARDLAVARRELDAFRLGTAALQDDHLRISRENAELRERVGDEIAQNSAGRYALAKPRGWRAWWSMS